jgi:hypothetical protein
MMWVGMAPGEVCGGRGLHERSVLPGACSCGAASGARREWENLPWVALHFSQHPPRMLQCLHEALEVGW